MIDFTDSTRPTEIASFDRGPIDAKHPVLGGYWSTYWYGGRIYGSEIVRGLDVLTLTPGDNLSEAEIAAAALADQGRTFNPQQQFPVTWPDHPVVAQAYVDQLQRQSALPAPVVADLTASLTAAAAPIVSGAKDAALAGRLDALASGLQVDNPDAAAARRLVALQSTLRGVVRALR